MAVTWNLENAAHLLRRVAFGGSNADVQAFFSRHGDVGSAVDELLGFKASKSRPPVAKDTFDLTKIHRWLFVQYVNGKPADCCREKLVLFWQNHFVSGVSKQPNASYLPLQNSLFRTFAKGNFKDLYRAFQRDPANLYYLDGVTSVATNDDFGDGKPVPRAQPNENFGRECLELFGLGLFQLAADGSFDTTLSNYTEADVHQLARALTGWVNITKKNVAIFTPDLPYWDGGRCDDIGDGKPTPVTIFGITNNNFRIDDTVKGTADDVVELIFSRQDADGNNQPAMFLARKFWNAYAYPFPAAGLKALLAGFASILVSNKFEVAPMLKAMWTSDEFYSDAAKTRTVKFPVDYTVQALRLFEFKKYDGKNIGDGPELGEYCAEMDQRLFDPPNVAGWKGGLTWINSGSLLRRLDFAKNLAAADGKKNSWQLSIIPNLPTGATADPAAVVDAVLSFIGLNSGPLAIGDTERARLVAYASSGGPTLDLSSTTTDDARIKVRGVVALALQCPEMMIH